MDKDDIYKEYHDKVMRYILGKNISPFDAEDICQSVFIKIMNNLDSFDQTKSSISTWIYTITQNTVYTHYRTTSRAQKRFFCLGGGDEQAEDIGFVDSSFENILNDESLSELARALESLDDRSRNLIIYIYYDGMTMKAASEKLQISYANAKIIIKKAFAELKEKLA